MSALDWSGIGMGAVLGVLAAGVFFAGLAWGMQIALRKAHPAPFLLLSAALRIAGLLALGLWVAGQGAAVSAGFVLTFIVTRMCILLVARHPRPAERASWT